MKKNKSLATLLMVLIFIAVNVIFFIWVTPAQCGPVEWISYGFMVASFIFACVAMMTYNGKSDEVYSLSTVYVALKYFYVQTVLSALGVIGAQLIRSAQSSQAASQVASYVPAKYAFIIEHYFVLITSIYILVCLFYVIRFIVHSKANRATEQSLQQQHEEHSYVRDLGGTLANLLPMVSDTNAKKAVNNLYETVRFSANKTTASGSSNRQQVAQGLAKLSELIAAKDWQGVSDLATQLNSIAKQQ